MRIIICTCMHILDRMGQKKRGGKPRENVGFLLSCFICTCKCTRTMKERRRAGVHKFTFVRWKE